VRSSRVASVESHSPAACYLGFWDPRDVSGRDYSGHRGISRWGRWRHGRRRSI